MARAPSPAEFLDGVEKSKLLGPAAVEPYRGSLDKYATADELADALVADGLVTPFQASHLRQGKWHGFFLGTYKMLDKLGAGGSAVVYLAEHVRLKQRVAIKVLSFQKAKDAEALGRFEREAKAAAAVRHPHVVHAFDVATEGRLHYMVMEYVDGVTLLKQLTERGRMAPRRIAKLMHQAAQGLHAAHRAGIVHRDVKPSNLMIDAGGAVKVMDLGLARYEADETALTQGKAVLGIAAYTAPEQMAANAAVDARADVYALGATFHLAATGKRPLVLGAPGPDIAARTPAEEPEYRKLMSLIGRMMAVRPEDRYQSMADVSAALSVSGLLAEPKAKPPAAPVAADRPIRPVSRPSVEVPSTPPMPMAVEYQPDEIPYAVAVADEPTPAHVTPMPKQFRSPAPLPKSFGEVSPVEEPDAAFDFRVRGLFESLGRTDPDAAVAVEPEPVTVRRAVPAQNPAVKWLVAGGTFAVVLATLLLLVR